MLMLGRYVLNMLDCIFGIFILFCTVLCFTLSLSSSGSLVLLKP